MSPVSFFKEPAFINFIQFLGYVLAGIAGFLAMIGGLPNLVTAQIGPVLSVAVGIVLVLGCILGSVAVATGHWWLERVALMVTGLGWVLLLVPTLFFAFRGTATSSTIWLILALEIRVIFDEIKRYRRIDWAYLDPAK
jgi:hypothetical protein